MDVHASDQLREGYYQQNSDLFKPWRLFFLLPSSKYPHSWHGGAAWKSRHHSVQGTGKVDWQEDFSNGAGTRQQVANKKKFFPNSMVKRAHKYIGRIQGLFISYAKHQQFKLSAVTFTRCNHNVIIVSNISILPHSLHVFSFEESNLGIEVVEKRMDFFTSIYFHQRSHHNGKIILTTKESVFFII